MLFKESSSQGELKPGLVVKSDCSTSTKRPKRPSSAPHRRNRPKFDRRIQIPQYRPVTPMYRAKWTADKLEAIEDSHRYNRRAHYECLRRPRSPSLRPYPGGGSPKHPTYWINV